MYVCEGAYIIVVCFKAVKLVVMLCCPYSVVGPALNVDNITEKLPDTFKVGLTCSSHTYMFSVMLPLLLPSNVYT